jgi:hypothetical protein
LTSDIPNQLKQLENKIDFGQKEAKENQEKTLIEVRRVEGEAIAKIGEQTKNLTDFDIRIQETEDTLKEKADESKMILSSIKEIDLKTSKGLAEMNGIIFETNEGLNKELEKVKGIMGKMENANNNKLG